MHAKKKTVFNISGKIKLLIILFNFITQAVLKRYAVCSNLDFYKSKCILSCDSGFEIVGNTFTECLDTGRWSQTIGTCESLFNI